MLDEVKYLFFTHIIDRYVITRTSDYPASPGYDIADVSLPDGFDRVVNFDKIMSI